MRYLKEEKSIEDINKIDKNIVVEYPKYKGINDSIIVKNESSNYIAWMANESFQKVDNNISKYRITMFCLDY